MNFNINYIFCFLRLFLRVKFQNQNKMIKIYDMWFIVCQQFTVGNFVRLSLLTMTNPNQLCDVLLFACSKMADETNLSSKLPVADRTREV